MASHRIFTTSRKAWQGMLSAIVAARESVYLEMYIFENDTEGYNFLGELENSARRGVRVIVILDVLGSWTLAKEVIEKLRTAGVEVLFYSFFLRRTHRKILIVDKKVAFVGGVNIGRRYAFWKDLQVRVSGRVVEPVVRSFARVYRDCGGKDDILPDIGRRSLIYKTKLWFLERGVGRREYLLRKYYEQRISQAKGSIIIVTPYLLPPRWLLAHLHQAVIRGVSLQILMPKASDHRLANEVNRSFATFFSKLGAKCFFMPGMNHAKTMLIDEREGMIGSQNLDRLSFDWNIEAGIFFSELKMVEDLKKIINGWKNEAVLFDPSKTKFHWYDIPIAFLLRLFGFLPLW